MDDGEGAGAQGHSVKVEIEILARNACMGIYKSSGYNPQKRLPRPIKAGPMVAWMESHCMLALASTSAVPALKSPPCRKRDLLLARMTNLSHESSRQSALSWNPRNWT